MNDQRHLDEDAELHALGALDPQAALEAQRHIAACAACAERVALARLAAASLAATLPPEEPSAQLDARIRAAMRIAPSAPRRAPAFDRRMLATAAALVVALGANAWQAVEFVRRDAREEAVLGTLVHSHFNHVAMAPRSNGAPPAKVLYGKPPARWLYVVVAGPAGGLRAVGHSRSGVVDLGALSGDGRAASLFAEPSVDVTSVDLVRDGAAIASARLIF